MPASVNDRTVATIWPTDSALTLANRWDHFLARWGVNRSGHRVDPGLYSVGNPTTESPVFVTANYTLSFDALRADLGGVDGYILALDTQGINVWCAAGKGTFGTDELVNRIKVTGLGAVVGHRELVLPQLGAPGVAAHEVRKRSGFRVEYGPVRASDLPVYLEQGAATAEMRRVTFDLFDRAVLIPVELVHVLLPMMVVAVVLFLLSGALASLAALASILAGTVLFPILLPFLPTREFSTKGFILGAIVAVPFAAAAFAHDPQAVLWQRVLAVLAYLLAMPPVTAFLALNFTGSTTFTSRTGVRQEIFAYIPFMAGTFTVGLTLMLVAVLVGMLGAA